MKLIDKDALVAEIERKIEAHKETLKNCDSSISEMVLKGSMSAYQSLLYFLNTLEVKEVDEEYNGKAMLHILEKGVKQGRREILNNLWKPAGGNNLPEVDREVIVLLSNNKVCFAHRPQEYWDGKNIATEEITRYYPKRYDKGGWNIPDVKWWLDLDLPKMEE